MSTELSTGNPIQEPKAAMEPRDPGGVRLRYKFEMVPAPLMPRLLVKTFSLVPDELHWRRGAVLAYGEATAKVWSTQDERWVYATIAGPAEAREDLAKILRTTLRELFAEYKNLAVTEQMEWEGEWVPRATLEKIGQMASAEAGERREEDLKR